MSPDPSERLYGPDVSRYQPDTDWARVRAAGNAFGIVKATQGAPAGRPYVNVHLRHDLAGLTDNGMIYGTYHFGDPKCSPGEAGARREAEHYAATMVEHGGLGGPATMRAILDLEGHYIAGYGRSALATWIEAWFERVNEILGTTGGIVYANRHDAARQMDGARLCVSGYRLWLAHWTYRSDLPQGAAPAHWDGFVLQQYTDRAEVPGIRGACDRNVAWSDLTPLLAVD